MEGVRKCGRRCGEMCLGVEKCGGRKGEMWGGEENVEGGGENG